MNETWYNTPKKIAALESAAASWLGTPFGQNGSAKGPGGGVSCQKLAAALYVQAACLESFDPPPAPMGWARHQAESLIEKYMDSHPRFVRVIDGKPIPGDVLGFRIQKCTHHMGIALTGGRFVHVWQQTGVMISLLADSTYSKRLSAIWRPTP